MKTAAIIGASGAIGSAFARQLREQHPEIRLFGFSRTAQDEHPLDQWHPMDITSEDSIKAAAQHIDTPLDLVLVTSGILHGENFGPEKALRDLSADTLQDVLQVNTIGPALVMKHMLPKLRRPKVHSKERAVFAALSARVGSISDNRLGGWYAYRASKAALNMLLKTASIETARTNKNAVVIGLHPGTVDSALSKPFQRGVPDGKLFSPDYSAGKLLEVIREVRPADSGKMFDYAGKEIPA